MKRGLILFLIILILLLFINGAFASENVGDELAQSVNYNDDLPIDNVRHDNMSVELNTNKKTDDDILAKNYDKNAYVSITANPTSVNLGDTVSIVCDLSDDSSNYVTSGKLILSINGVEKDTYTTPSNNGKYSSYTFHWVSDIAGDSIKIQVDFTEHPNAKTYKDSTSNIVYVQVNDIITKKATAITLSDINPVTAGSYATLSAEVSSGSAVNGGTVRYYYGSGTFINESDVSNGISSVRFYPPSVGTYYIYAKYFGSDEFEDSDYSATRQLTVNALPTSTTLSFSSTSNVNTKTISRGNMVTVYSNVNYGNTLITDGSVSYYYIYNSQQTSINPVSGSNTRTATFTPNSVGTYYIYASFNGYGNYNSSDSKTAIILTVADNKSPTTTELIIVPSSSISYGDEIILTANVLSSGISVNQGNVEYYMGTQLIATSAVGQPVTYTPLSYGTLLFSAKYSGSNNHESSESDTVSLNVKYKTSIDFNINQNSVYTQDLITLSASVKTNSLKTPETGYIHYYYSNDTYIGNSTINGTYSFKITNSGNYSIYAYYKDTSNTYDDVKSSNSNIRVLKTPTNLTLNISPSTLLVGEKVVFMPTLTANGVNLTWMRIYFYEDNGRYYGQGFSNRIFDFIVANPGNHNIMAKYNGDDTYEASQTAVFTQYNVRYPSTVLADLNQTFTTKGKEILITPKVISDGRYVTNGIVELYVDGISRGLINLGDNYTYITNKTGNIPIYVKYNGSEYYSGNVSETENLRVIEENSFYMFLDADYDSNKSELNISVAMPEDASGDVKFTVNGVNYDYSYYKNGLAYLTILTEGGKFNIDVSFLGDNNYLPASRSLNYTINFSPFINVTANDVYVGRNAQIFVKLPGDATGRVNLTINGKSYSYLLSSGMSSFQITNLKVGLYPFNVTYSGDGFYLPSFQNGTLNVTRTKDYEITFEVFENDDELILVESLIPAKLTNGNNAEYYLNGKSYVEYYDGIQYDFNSGIDTSENYYWAFYEIYTPDKGKYNFTVYYPGDDYYDEGNFSYVVYYDLIEDYNVTFEVGESIAGFNTSAVVKLPENSTGSVSITLVEGYYDTYYANISNGIAAFTIPDLKAGSRYVRIDYYGDENYSPKTVYGNIIETVKANATFDIGNMDDIWENEEFTINILLNPKIATGEVRLIINNSYSYEQFNITLNNASVKLNDFLDSGQYTLTVIYGGDGNVNPNTTSVEFNVGHKNNLKNPDMNITVFNASFMDTAWIYVYLPGNATGNVSTVIAGKNYSTTVRGHITVIPINNLDVGSYDIIIGYSGNGEYLSSEVNGVLKISKIDNYAFDIEIGESIVGDDTNITVTLPLDAKGNVTLKINNRTFNKSINNSIAVFTVDDLTAANHTLLVEYLGDEKYVNKSISKTLSTKKGNATVTLNVKDINYSEQYTVNFTVYNKLAAGKYIITIGNKTYNGILNYSNPVVLKDFPQNAGEYNVTLIYYDDSNFNEKAVFDKFYVSPVTSKIKVNAESITYGENAVIEVELDENTTGIIYLYISDKILNETLKKGIAIFNLTNLNAGDYDINISYSGDGNYNSASNSSKFTVFKSGDYDYNIDVKGNDLAITLPCDATGNITLTVDNIKQIIPINSSTTKIHMNLTPGKHTINVTYSGDNNYIPFSNVTDINYIESIFDLIIETQNVTYGDEIIIYAYLPKNLTGNVVFEVNEISYNAQINDGIAFKKINQLSAGNWTVKVTYSGGSSYGFKTNSTIFNIKKSNAKLQITVDNNTYNKTAVIKVTLNDNANGNISILINNKTYAGALNKSFEIADIGVGNYTAFITYSGDENHTESTSEFKFAYNPNDDYEMSVYVFNSSVDKNAGVCVKLPEDAKGVIVVNILDKTFTSAVNNGLANVSIYSLSVNNYTILVKYLNDTNYISKNTTAELEIYKIRDYMININKTVFDGEKSVIFINLPVNANSDVNITVDGIIYRNKTINGLLSVETTLCPGEYNITVSYGDDNYEYQSVTKRITIDKLTDYPFILDSNPIYVGNDGIINVTLPLDADGIVYTIWDGRNYTMDSNNQIIIPNLSEGSYYIPVTYTGNYKYNQSTKEAVIAVSTVIDYDFTATADPIHVGETALIKINLPKDADSLVFVMWDSKTYLANNNIIEIPGLAEGNYYIPVTYQGDSKYKQSTIIATVKVSKVTDYEFLLNTSVTYVGEDVIINVILPFDAEGLVYAKFNNTTYMKYSNNQIIIPNLGEGNYSIPVTYDGDDKYSSATKIANITVFKINNPVIISIADNNSIVVNITLPDNHEGNITITVDGKNYTTQNTDAIENSFNIGNLTPGNHTITVFYSGDEKHSSFENTTVITIPKINDYLFNITDDSVHIGENATINIRLPDDAKGFVYIIQNSNNHSAEIKNGYASINIPDLVNNHNELMVTYTGDNNYTSKSKIANVYVSKIDEYKFDINIGNDNLSIELPGDVKNNIIVNIDGKNQTLSYNGKLNINLSDLPPGNHTVEITYPGDDKYDLKTSSKSITIPKINNYIFTVTNHSVNAGDSVTINIQLPVDAKGNISAVFNDKSYSSGIYNGKAKITLPNLPEGRYSVQINYSGDNNYTSGYKISTVTVSKISNYTLNIDVNNKKLFINVFDNMKANVTIIIDGKSQTLPLSNGKVSVDLSNLAPGNHNIEVICSGDDKYSQKTNTSTITVPKIDDYTFTLNTNSVNVGDNAVINVQLPADAKGSVSASVNGRTYYGTVLNGKSKITVPDLSKANYTIPVTYTGDNNYTSKTKTVNVIVSKLSNYPFEIQYLNKTILVNLPMDAEGSVSATINAKSYSGIINNGSATINLSDLPSGNYMPTIIYSGDNKYTQAIKSTSFNIKEENPIKITVNDVVKYYKGNERLVAEIKYANGTGISGEKVIFAINGNTYSRNTSGDGSASIALNLNSGNYTAIVTVNNTQYNVNIIIKPTVMANDVTKVFRNATQYYAYFVDTKGNPLADGTEVTFNINGVFYTRLVNGSEGRARLNLNLEQGTYILTAINPSTGENAANKITIIPRLQENRDLTKYFRNSTQYSLRVIGDDGKFESNAKVTFNINGVFYTRTSNNNGYVNLNINLEPGTYILTAEYKNCKVSNTVVVLPILTASDLTMKYRDGSRFNVKLVDGQGNAYPNQKITFNFRGNYYEKITDNNGIASLGIISPEGKYIITSVYNDARLSNTITVTK